MTPWIAMLRTVTPDGGERVAMAAWRQWALQSGAHRPRTWLQGGNLVFDLDPAQLEPVMKTLREGMKAQLGVEVPMVVRSGVDVLVEERKTPFHDHDKRRVFLGFLSSTPDPKLVEGLEAPGSGDQLVVRGDVVHISYGSDPAKSGLTAEWLEEKLGVDCILRSWNAVTELIKMADPPRDVVGPGLRGLSYVMVMVSNMDRSVAFYRDALGLECTLQTPFWSELAAGGCRIALHAGGAEGAVDGKAAGMASLGFNVADLDATHAALVERGVAFSQPPTDRPQEGIRLAVATDPDGLVINFAQSTR